MLFILKTSFLEEDDEYKIPVNPMTAFEIWRPIRDAICGDISINGKFPVRIQLFEIDTKDNVALSNVEEIIKPHHPICEYKTEDKMEENIHFSEIDRKKLEKFWQIEKWVQAKGFKNPWQYISKGTQNAHYQ